MNGSEKQIKWAEKIKAATISRMNENRDFWLYAVAMEIVNAVDSASDWIDWRYWEQTGTPEQVAEISGLLYEMRSDRALYDKFIRKLGAAMDLPDDASEISIRHGLKQNQFMLMRRKDARVAL